MSRQPLSSSFVGSPWLGPLFFSSSPAAILTSCLPTSHCEAGPFPQAQHQPRPAMNDPDYGWNVDTPKDGVVHDFENFKVDYRQIVSPL